MIWGNLLDKGEKGRVIHLHLECSLSFQLNFSAVNMSPHFRKDEFSKQVHVCLSSVPAYSGKGSII